MMKPHADPRVQPVRNESYLRNTARADYTASNMLSLQTLVNAFRSATTQMQTTKQPILSSAHAMLQESLRESVFEALTVQLGDPGSGRPRHICPVPIPVRRG
jgi:hypothetical protein